MAVTKEQIFSAADLIAAEDQTPTMESIRRQIGGSYSTIGPVLKEWKARQAQASLREPPPQVLHDSLLALGSKFWNHALDLTNSRVAAEREQLEHAQFEMEREQTEATELADRLTGQVEALQSRLSAMEAERLSTHTEVTDLREQLADAVAQAQTSEARIHEIEHRVTDLQRELERAHQLHQEQRKQMAAETHRQTERLTLIQNERDNALHEAATLAGQISVYQEQISALLSRIPKGS